MLKKKITKKMETLIMYKKGPDTFCREVDRSRDIERSAFFKMAATLISIRPRQSRFRLWRHPPTSSEIIPYSFFFHAIEDSKLACDTGGHFTNYPTWPLPRTNPNVDVLNNSLNYYALADLMLYRLSVNIKHITLCLQTF